MTTNPSFMVVDENNTPIGFVTPNLIIDAGDRLAYLLAGTAGVDDAESQRLIFQIVTGNRSDLAVGGILSRAMLTMVTQILAPILECAEAAAPDADFRGKLLAIARMHDEDDTPGDAA